MPGQTNNKWAIAEYWEQRFRDLNQPWDLGEVHPTLIDLEKRALLQKRSTVIVPGCGRGSDALYFARQGHLVSGVDWSETALEDIRVIARREELEMELLTSSMWSVPKSWNGTFDLWVEHTFFCAIDPFDRSLYLEKALELLKPKGQLVGVFFVTEDPPGTPLIPDESGEVGPPFSSTEKELRELFGRDFDILTLEPTPLGHPNRGPFEWRVHLQRK